MPDDPPRRGQPDDPPRTDPATTSKAAEWGYDDYLRELDRLAADREAANRRKSESRSLSLVALGLALVALGISVAALALAALRT